MMKLLQPRLVEIVVKFADLMELLLLQECIPGPAEELLAVGTTAAGSVLCHVRRRPTSTNRD